jgi:hypothetical protein
MSNSPVDADDLLAVAFSLYANPGAYALLLGAGVSAPSGIPTAWGVLEDLVIRVANVQGVTPDDAVAWYTEQFGEFPTYEGVLERIAPTQVERQRLLRNYFEQSPEDVEAGRKIPTAAHRSIARLVRSGAVKVIVTLNFDHLIERALRDEGIEPTIVASPSDVQGMAPLHTLDCCVIHLHGDYVNPTSMLNTVTELAAYHPSTSKLLQMVLENYGLIIAGWSSTYDPALRDAIAAHYPNRFTLTWFEPGRVSEEAGQLRMLKKGVLVAGDADTGFGRMADGADALASRRARHPLTVPVAVETAKRELSGRTVAIGLHDTLRREFAVLHQLPEFNLATHEGGEDYEAMLARIEEASRMTGALVATLTYWGDNTTDNWWIDELPRFATPVDGSGLVRLLSLRVVSGSVLFYAAGVAAVAAQRFDLLGRLFALQRPNRYNGGYEAFAVSLDAESGYENARNTPTRVYDTVTPLLSEALSLSSEALNDSWQLFEVLRLAWVVHRHPRFAQLHMSYTEMDEAYQDAGALQSRDRVLGILSGLAPIRRPHVLTADLRMGERYQSVTATRLVHDLKAEGAAHPLITSGFTTNPKSFAVAVAAVNTRLGAVGSELSWSRGNGFIPSQIWLDTGKTPEELAAQLRQTP